MHDGGSTGIRPSAGGMRAGLEHGEMHPNRMHHGMSHSALFLRSEAAGQQVLLLKATREAHMVKVCPVIQLIFPRLLVSAAASGKIYYSAPFRVVHRPDKCSSLIICSLYWGLCVHACHPARRRSSSRISRSTSCTMALG